MNIRNLEVFQYRNFERGDVSFCRETNVFTGRNGQGKTNLLEAIYLLGYGKSFRTANPKECIQHGQNECSVSGLAEQEGGIARRLQVTISRTEKRLLIHGKAAPVDEFIGSLHVYAFTSDHLKIVRGSPSERRSFLDRAMFTLYPGHIRNLAAYGRALKQRNRFLGVARERQFVDEAQLESWDQALVNEGAPVIWNRMRYVTRMKAEIPEALFGTELLRIHYLSTVAAGAATLSEIETLFRAALHRCRDLDLRLGFTSVGPHRDDLKMILNGRALGEFGSAGQQRSSLLSLYFAQMEIHRKTHGFYPVFLVDDVEAELDDLRLRAFIDYLSRRTQTFLTTAKEGLLPSFPGETRRFEIRAGNILC